MPPLRPAGRTIKPTDSDETSSNSEGASPRERRPSALSYLQPASKAKRAFEIFRNSLNFYRVHLLTFTFVPLIASGVMYASNGQIHVAYIDCLFNCVSAFCVCGLASVNLSTLTGWQQTILFILMIGGSPVSVSIIMILVRRHFFRLKFKHIIEAQQKRRRDEEEAQGRTRRPSIFSVSAVRPSNLFGSNNGNDGPSPSVTLINDEPSSLFQRLRTKLPTQLGGMPGKSLTTEDEEQRRIQKEARRKEVKGFREREKAERIRREKEEKKEREERKEKEKQAGHHHGGRGMLRTDMIKRVEGDAYLINPNGQRGGVAVERMASPGTEERQAEEEDDEEEMLPRDKKPADDAPVHFGERTTTPTETSLMDAGDEKLALKLSIPPRRASEPDSHPNSDTFPRSKTIAFDPDQSMPQHRDQHQHNQYLHPAEKPTAKHFPRTGTIEFVGTAPRRRNNGMVNDSPAFERTATHRSGAGTLRGPPPSSLFPRSTTMRTTAARSTKHSGFGGFPMPHEIVHSAVAYFFPQVEQKIKRTMTLQPTPTFASGRSGTATLSGGGAGAVPVPYISFDAVVGRNSQFKDLTSEQLEELGGVEYRGLKVLTWVVPLYFIGLQLCGFIIFWPYIGAKGRYAHVFDSQPRLVPLGWFAAFQSVSSFSNTGMSLVDMSMLPFQTAYVMIFFMIFLVLAGNTAYPIFLRFTIWLIACACPSTSRLHETCRFLLDHPRRCYTYLFPAHQTVFLSLVIVIMTLTDWVSFLVLDIGTPVIEAIPVGTRISAAFLQSAAVRAAGFSIVPLASLAPAVKVLYIIMMYISVYPIAMSVRATNVYEERSLGVFNDDDGASLADEEMEKQAGSRVVGWSKYISFHARRQLAFDIWWLGLALWLVCIIERSELNDITNESYFNTFSVIFEIVSAYGTVGLSLGLSYDNFSLVGGFQVLSKLIFCVVMIRGRHRGLPVAIDRSVMLPKEFEEQDQEVLEEERTRRSRRGSTSSFNFPTSDTPHSLHFPTSPIDSSNPNTLSHHPTHLSATNTASSAHRRKSSLSTNPRRRPSVPQPFFPSKHGVNPEEDESALADDGPESPPPQLATSLPPPSAASTGAAMAEGDLGLSSFPISSSGGGIIAGLEGRTVGGGGGGGNVGSGTASGGATPWSAANFGAHMHSGVGGALTPVIESRPPSANPTPIHSVSHTPDRIISPTPTPPANPHRPLPLPVITTSESSPKLA